jgi:transcription elongation factor Elf1
MTWSKVLSKKSPRRLPSRVNYNRPSYELLDKFRRCNSCAHDSSSATPYNVTKKYSTSTVSYQNCAPDLKLETKHIPTVGVGEVPVVHNKFLPRFNVAERDQVTKTHVLVEP